MNFRRLFGQFNRGDLKQSQKEAKRLGNAELAEEAADGSRQSQKGKKGAILGSIHPATTKKSLPQSFVMDDKAGTGLWQTDGTASAKSVCRPILPSPKASLARHITAYA